MDKRETNYNKKDQELLVKELQAELKLKNQCLALLAHDFAGISRNLLWITGALEDGSISPDIFKSLLPELKETVQTNQRAIESTVAWVNNQHASFEPKAVTINAFALFSSIRDFFVDSFKSKGINFRFEGDAGIKIHSDEKLVEFILKKAVDNAIKYSYDGKDIIFHARQDDDGTSIVIEDFGAGMDQQTLTNLFTLNGSPNTGTFNEKGTGLSLVIANDFAKLIKGSLNASSEENYGTTIELRLSV